MSTEHSETLEAESAPIRILIVDNDPDHADVMYESLERTGYSCDKATSGPDGAACIEQEHYDIVITDLVMEGVDGMELLGRAKESLPDSEVIMVTGHASVPKAVEAMQQGAFTFLEKPITPKRLRATTARAAEAVRLRRDNVRLNQRLDKRYGFEGIIYASDKMKMVIERLKRIAPTDATVLITGENGTGKELIAEAIHQNSPRKGKRMLPLHLGALPEHLLESELFGHKKGAFTTALDDRIGAFEYANGGTLFLDELGDMPQQAQIKLLRVLEERQITRIGDNRRISVNVRVLSATNRDLEEAIEQGTFRRDLYYRLKVVTVELPSLKERPEDVIPLAEHFRKQFVRQHHHEAAHISPQVRQRLYSYEWPGNVRQLRNFIENMVVLDTDGVLDVDDLPPELADRDETPTAVSDGQLGLVGKPFKEIERYFLLETLKLTNGNREEAARILGIGARTVYRKLKDHGVGGDS